MDQEGHDDHGGDGHAHEAPMLVGHDGQLHPSNLQHFFVSSEQQFEASKLGMWLFLATEALLFGGIFAGYLGYRVLHPETFAAAAAHMKVGLGTLNTAVLLTSSLTVALAHHLVQQGRRRATLVLLGATIAQQRRGGDTP